MLAFFGSCQIAYAGDNSCYLSSPEGTVPACGEGEGYFRPQPETLSSDWKVVKNPGTYYAPIGKKGKKWRQYYPDDDSYGPEEPNPYKMDGKRSSLRTLNHLFETRVKKRIKRRFSNGNDD